MLGDKACEIHTEEIKDIRSFISTTSVVMENINKNITMLVAKDDKKQDAIMTMLSDNSHMIERLNEHASMINKISETQMKGCPSLNNAVELRKLETDSLKIAISALTTASKKNREEIDNNSKHIEVLTERVNVSNKRVLDLELYQEKNEVWKQTNYKFWIANGFLVICGLVGIIYQGVAK